MRKRIEKRQYQISEANIEEAKQKFLGKKIEFQTQNNMRHVGVCEYLGPNQFFPSWGIQITVDRTPFPRLAKVAILTTNADSENDVEYSSKCRAEYCTATFAKRVLCVCALFVNT